MPVYFGQTSVSAIALGNVFLTARMGQEVVISNGIKIPGFFTSAFDSSPSNGTVIAAITADKVPFPSQTTWSITGDTVGATVNATTGVITVSNSSQFSYANGKTRLIVLTASDPFSSASCLVQVNLASGWYRTPLASPTLRPVADNTRLPQGLSPSGMTEGRYISTHEVFTWNIEGGLKVRYNNRSPETSTGLSTISISAKIEYPINSGNWTTFLFGGNTTGTIAAGTDIESDTLALNIPARSKIRIDTYVRGTRWPVLDQKSLRKSRFEGAVVGTTDLSGVVVESSDSSTCYGPSAILGQSRAPVAAALVGDSITNGIFYNADDPLASWVEHLLYGRIPWVQASTYGDNGYNIRLNHAGRIAHIKACGVNRSIQLLGSNDIANASYTVPQTQENDIVLGSLLYQLGAQPTISTITTRTNSTDKWKTLENQTVKTARFAVGGDADTLNTGRLALPQFYARVIDPRSGFQNANNLILVDGTEYKYTPVEDGTHQTIFANIKMAAAVDIDNVFNSATFTPATPAALATATAIFDAETLRGSLADGAQVLSWVDTVASMTATGTAGTTAPTFVANGPNGKASVKAVSASNQRLVVSGANATAIENLFDGGGTAVFVFKSNSAGASNFGAAATKGSTAASRSTYMRNANFAGTIGMSIGRSTTAYSSSTNGVTAGEWHTTAFKISTADYAGIRWMTDFFGGAMTPNPLGSGTSNSDAGQNFVIFNTTDFNRGYDGEVAWFGLWQNSPTDAQINELVSWLREKYGTTNG